MPDGQNEKSLRLLNTVREDILDVVVDRFHIALFSALEQTHKTE